MSLKAEGGTCRYVRGRRVKACRKRKASRKQAPLDQPFDYAKTTTTVLISALIFNPTIITASTIMVISLIKGIFMMKKAYDDFERSTFERGSSGCRSHDKWHTNQEGRTTLELIRPGYSVYECSNDHIEEF